MVEQAVKQTYTYYSPEHPQGEGVENAPLAGHGKAWTLGAYRHPTYPSPLNVRVGDAGIKIWMAIEWLHRMNDDKERVLENYGHVLELADIEAAIWHYNKNKEAIDQKITEEAESA